MNARALIAVTHLLGAGHLTRAAAVGRALAAAGAEVTLVSGGWPMPLIDKTGLDFVQLPALSTRVGEFTLLRDAEDRPVDAAYLARRRRDLLAAFARTDPDILVTELYPFGRRALAGEFDALLDAATSPDRDRRVLVAASVRDILAPPSTPAKAAHAHAIVQRRYDLVLVHGDERVTPLEASWPVDVELASRLVYTGYVDPDPPDARLARNRSTGEIVVSGGSSIAGLPLYQAALAAADRDLGRRWRILVGAAVPGDSFVALRGRAGPNVAVERARSDFRDLLRACRVFVGQAGYNTVMDLLATGTSAVLVPFERGGETEQRLRADELGRRGLAHVIPEDRLSADTLSAAIRHAEALPSGVSRPAVARDGAERSARVLLDGLHAPIPRAHAYARVDA